MDVNRIMLAGNLTRDPVMSEMQSGSAVTKFGLAINQRYKTRDGEQREDTCFVDVDVWGRQAQQCEQYLAKGAPAFVEGKLQMSQWEDRDTGQRRQRLFVRADRVHFLGFAGSINSEQQDSDMPDFEMQDSRSKTGSKQRHVVRQPAGNRRAN